MSFQIIIALAAMAIAIIAIKWEDPTPRVRHILITLAVVTCALGIFKAIHTLPGGLYTVFRSSAVIGWVTIAAEVAVAIVIYLELEHNRQQHYFRMAADEKTLAGRREIFDAYISFARGSNQMGQEFYEKHIKNNSARRQICDQQISLLNEMGFTATRWFSRGDTLVKLNPYGPIFLWITVGAYMTERRNDTGRYWARHMFKMLLKCVKLVEKHYAPNCPLRIRDMNGNNSDVPITLMDLGRIEAEIRALLKAK